ncbi:DUF6463 family protein [Streptosporangium sp. NPDC000396]|uniref:DUF6463 family protein n=1 Tax=Streptosporangium sp. NPDC000396 TaxID=3366185 RepID=UPI0036C2F142
MSIGTDSAVKARSESGRARTLSVWAGGISAAIGVVHTVFFSIKTWPQWGDWISGGLHGTDTLKDPAVLASARDFWSLSGSFAVPLILLGLLISHMARTGQKIPSYLGWALGVWVLVNAWILEPSGFPLGIIPVALLLLAKRAEHRNR